MLVIRQSPFEPAYIAYVVSLKKRFDGIQSVSIQINGRTALLFTVLKWALFFDWLANGNTTARPSSVVHDPSDKMILTTMCGIILLAPWLVFLRPVHISKSINRKQTY